MIIRVRCTTVREYSSSRDCDGPLPHRCRSGFPIRGRDDSRRLRLFSLPISVNAASTAFHRLQQTNRMDVSHLSSWVLVAVGTNLGHTSSTRFGRWGEKSDQDKVRSASSLHDWGPFDGLWQHVELSPTRTIKGSESFRPAERRSSF